MQAKTAIKFRTEKNDATVVSFDMFRRSHRFSVGTDYAFKIQIAFETGECLPL